MSLSELRVEEIEERLENHLWYSPAWSYNDRSYPERWDSIADGDETWHIFDVRLGKAYKDDDNGRWKKGEDAYEDIPGVGRVFLEKQHGGEGEGDDYYIVLRIEGDVTRYFIKQGYHASFDGSYLDGDFSEVHPVEKTVVVYE